MEQYISILKQAKLFHGMTEQEITQILSCLSAITRTYKRGDNIFHRGDCVTTVAMLLSGTVHIQKEDY